ncbi:unnamed protein product [Plutella xylostella]|uniref:(diamondback moth) hypothetical protein n=1 Tax=Plutella xylostella TaxID=51655 RepID=A0A8S4D3C2_PLUXY|nr:unnamed protein product [Plutella xylostella]
MSSAYGLERVGNSIINRGEFSGCADAGAASWVPTAAGAASVAMYRRRYRATLGLGLGSSFSSSFSTTLSFRTSTLTSPPTATDSVRSDAKATAAKLKSKYENTGTAQGALCAKLLLGRCTY